MDGRAPDRWRSVTIALTQRAITFPSSLLKEPFVSAILRLYGSIIWIPPVAICPTVFLFLSLSLSFSRVLSICLRLPFRPLASLFALALSHETLRNYCPMKLDVIHVPDVHDSFTTRTTSNAYNNRTCEIDTDSPVKDLISDIPDINARNWIACTLLPAKSRND